MRALPRWLAGVIVFVSSGSVLVLELLALRLIAPYVGITLETNSAVIGSALAGIALGAWAGGRAADVADPRVLVPGLLIVSGIAALLTVPAVRWVGGTVSGGDQSAVLLLALAAAFGPAALLSAVPPMVVKLQLRDLRQTGEVVGTLSGIGTVGAIVATFVTGFVLVAAFPTSAIVVVLGVVLVAGGVILLGYLRASAGGRSRVPLALVVAMAASGLALAARAPCDVETAYHCAKVEETPGEPTGRLLRLDNLSHSFVDTADPTYLRFTYIQAIASVADASAPARRPVAALHVGGGGFTMPRYLAAARPGSSSLVLEVDKGVVDLDRRKLGLRLSDQLRVRLGDGRVGLVEQPAGRYDLVVGDAFGGVAVPWHLTTREFVQQIRRVLTSGGTYAANIIDHPPDDFLRAEIATVRSVLRHVALLATVSAVAKQDGGNFVIVASQQPLPLAAIERRLQGRGTPYVSLTGAALDRFVGNAKVLTDDRAPVDQLLTQ